jgi:hypothetical protein
MNIEDDSHSVIEDEYEYEDSDDAEWGLSKGMELFEVSAKDNTGTSTIFLSLY